MKDSKDTNKGQSKTFTATNPSTGEVREVTQKQWREDKLGQQGFQKPEDLDESEEVDPAVEAETDDAESDQ